MSEAAGQPARKLREGVCVERSTAGCMCMAITAYDSSEFGNTEFHDLTNGVPVNGTSWCREMEGVCQCGKDVVYDQWLLVTGEKEVSDESSDV